MLGCIQQKSVCASGATKSSGIQLQRHPRSKQVTAAKLREKSSAEIYNKIFHTLLPRFDDYVTYEIPVTREDYVSKAFIIGFARLSHMTYDLKVDGICPQGGIHFKSYGRLVDDSPHSFFWLDFCFLSVPALNSSAYAPYSKNEAYFVISRELAHFVRATAVRYQVELDTIHYPELLRNVRYRWHRRHSSTPLELYSKLWPERARQHRLSAIMLGINAGGERAVRGGITYTARGLIYAYYQKEEYQGNCLLHRSHLRTVNAIIDENSEAIRTILTWFINKSLRAPASYQALQKKRAQVKRFYEKTIQLMPELRHISEQHQIDLLNLGNVTRAKG